MSEHMDQTTRTYKEHFEKFIEGTRGLDAPNADIKKWIDSFLQHIQKGGLIIEMGSAFGRDADYMQSRGYKVVCTDIADPALEKLVTKGYETHMYDVRDPVPEEWRRRYDGYFANAVLLHLTDDAFRLALTNAYDMLKHGGIAAFSLKIGMGDEVTSRKMDAPRYFRYYYKPEVETIINELPFDIISIEYTADEKWIVAVLRKR